MSFLTNKLTMPKGLLAAPRLAMGGVEALEALRSQEKGFASSIFHMVTPGSDFG